LHGTLGRNAPVALAVVPFDVGLVLRIRRVRRCIIGRRRCFLRLLLGLLGLGLSSRWAGLVATARGRTTLGIGTLGRTTVASLRRTTIASLRRTTIATLGRTTIATLGRTTIATLRGPTVTTLRRPTIPSVWRSATGRGKATARTTEPARDRKVARRGRQEPTRAARAAVATPGRTAVATPGRTAGRPASLALRVLLDLIHDEPLSLLDLLISATQDEVF
jgi:hypothetical protein